ncbi:response regulator transcription factor [Noviherbaspirillum aerium]|uniref:response regulator transcription factor n=1 Tax=Noviherbaspirillum aerium TaxID=2588497 RepID=UPI00178C4EE9|nr:response regulator [Noviherbaspirillum aerium]
MAPVNDVKIVIADDDNMTCSVLRLLLREQGFSVLGEARDGEKAVELCLLHRPDIAFLDIDMPRLSGHEAARKLSEQAPDTGIIMVSALPTLENVQKSVEAGAAGFVVKPFNAMKVMDAVGQCLQRGKDMKR